VRRDAGRRVVDEVCMLLPAGPERLVRAVPAWQRERGSGPAAEALTMLLARRGVTWRPV
jgi:pilus assembly protein CpaF